MSDWLIIPITETDSEYTKAYLGYESETSGVIVELDDHNPAAANKYVTTTNSVGAAVDFIASITGSERGLVDLVPLESVRGLRKQGYTVAIAQPVRASLEPAWMKTAPYEPAWIRTAGVL